MVASNVHIFLSFIVCFIVLLFSFMVYFISWYLLICFFCSFLFIHDVMFIYLFSCLFISSHFLSFLFIFFFFFFFSFFLEKKHYQSKPLACRPTTQFCCQAGDICQVDSNCSNGPYQLPVGFFWKANPANHIWRYPKCAEVCRSAPKCLHL